LKFIAATITTVVFGLLFVFMFSAPGHTAEIEQWTQVRDYAFQVRWPEAVFHNGFIYVAGGRLSDESPTDAVMYAAVRPDGSLSEWNNTEPLPGKRSLHAIAADENYLYLSGGWNSIVLNGYKDVWRAPFLKDGGIGPWENLRDLPQFIHLHDSVVANGYLYIIGGRTGEKTLDTVFYAPIEPDGLGEWRQTNNHMPHELRGLSAAVAGDFLYVTGGFDSKNHAQKQIYMTRLQANGDLSPWGDAIAELRQATNYHQAVIHNGRLTIIGGTDRPAANPSFQDVYSAAIDAEGKLSEWRIEPSLPQALSRFAAVVVQRADNEYIYTIGGQITDKHITNAVYNSTPLGIPTPTPTPTPLPSLNLRMINAPQGWIPPSEKITYTIRYENPGVESITEAEIRSLIPENTELVPGSINPGASDEHSSTGFRPGDQITWRFDEIEGGETDSVSYQVLRPLQPTSSGDPASITKTGPVAVAPGEPITYTLTLTNNTTQLLTNLIVEDHLPRRATYVSGGALNDDGYVRWVIPSLPKLGTTTVSFVVTANESLINSDYRVRFENVSAIVGRDIVITRVGDTPLPPEGDGEIITSKPVEASWRFQGQPGSASSNTVSNPSFNIYMPTISR
jgi:uncharacterized repeat protein (TIGR01451 family)